MAHLLRHFDVSWCHACHFKGRCLQDAAGSPHVDRFILVCDLAGGWLFVHWNKALEYPEVTCVCDLERLRG